MQLTVNAQALLRSLQPVKAGMLGSFPSSFPYVHVQARQGTLTCTAFHARLHVAASLVHDLTIGEEGECMVTYHDLVHALRSTSGTITLHAAALSLLVSQEGEHPRQFRLARKTPERLPAFSPLAEATPGATWTRKGTVQEKCAACQHTASREVTQIYRVTEIETQQMRLTKGRLLSLLEQVQWAANPAEQVKYTGVSLQIADQRLSLVATDGCCLAMSAGEAPGDGDWPRGVLVPARPFIQGARLLPAGEAVLMEAVFIHHALSQEGGQQEASDDVSVARPALFRLTAGGCVVTIPLLREDPPPYSSAIAHDCITRVVCDTNALRQALKAVVPMAESDLLSVRLFLAEKHIRVEAAGRSRSSMLAFCDCPTAGKTGPTVEVKLDCDFLSGVLRRIDTPSLSFDYCGPWKPVVIRPLGGRRDSRFAIMPMRN